MSRMSHYGCCGLQGLRASSHGWKIGLVIGQMVHNLHAKLPDEAQRLSRLVLHLVADAVLPLERRDSVLGIAMHLPQGRDAVAVLERSRDLVHAMVCIAGFGQHLPIPCRVGMELT